MDFWTLSRLAREWYQVEITTSPQITSWEVSYDKGQTWHQMFYDTETALNSSLVAGPDFTPDVGDPTPYVVLTQSVVPYVRAKDDPEVIIRSTPRIDLV